MSKSRFFPGKIETFSGVITKAASKVSTALPMTEAVHELGLDEQSIKEKYPTFRVDDVTFVQL